MTHAAPRPTTVSRMILETAVDRFVEDLCH